MSDETTTAQAIPRTELENLTDWIRRETQQELVAVTDEVQRLDALRMELSCDIVHLRLIENYLDLDQDKNAEGRLLVHRWHSKKVDAGVMQFKSNWSTTKAQSR